MVSLKLWTLFKLFLFHVAMIYQANGSSLLDDHTILHEGVLLRSAAFHFPPYMMIPDGNSTNLAGFSHDVLTYLAEHFNIKIDYVMVDQNDVRKYGFTQAVINQLVVKKEVDIVPMILIRSLQRQQIMDFTNPVRIGASRLMLPYPKEEDTAAASVVEPYSVDIWLLIVAAAFSVMMWITTAAYYHSIWFSETQYAGKTFITVLGYQFEYITTVTTCQGNYVPHTARFSVRLPAGLWCLVTVVLIGAFTGSITSFIAIPTRSLVANSIEELAASNNKYKVTAELNSATLEPFYKATGGTYKVIGDSLRRYPYLLFRDYNQATEFVLKYKAAYLRGNLEIINRIAADLRQNNGTCRLTASKLLNDVTFLSYGLPKGGAFNRAITRKLMPLWDTGLFDYWMAQYMPNIDECLLLETKRSGAHTSKSYDIHDLKGAFIFYLWGVAICVVVFAGELVYCRLCSSYSAKHGGSK